MPKLILLGTAAAIPTKDRDSTCFAIDFPNETILVDASGSIVGKLAKAAIALDKLSTVILTHAHPDHIFALPSLLQCMYLTRRDEPLSILGNPYTLSVAKDLLLPFDFYKKLPFNLTFYGEKFYESDSFHVELLEVKHNTPTVAVKVIDKKERKSIVYSSDTEPTEQFCEWAQSCDILIHECTFIKKYPYHTSPQELSWIIKKITPAKSVIVHINDPAQEYKRLIENYLNSEVVIGEDFMCFEV